jgi:hypothetical protein
MTLMEKRIMQIKKSAQGPTLWCGQERRSLRTVVKDFAQLHLHTSSACVALWLYLAVLTT